MNAVEWVSGGVERPEIEGSIIAHEATYTDLIAHSLPRREVMFELSPWLSVSQQFYNLPSWYAQLLQERYEASTGREMLP